MARKSGLQLKKERIQLYKAVFSTPNGKKVLYDLIAKNFVLQSSFNMNNVQATFYNEGKRSVVTEILAMMETDPNKFNKQIEEATKNAQDMEI